jgi:hypothetical protein
MYWAMQMQFAPAAVVEGNRPNGFRKGVNVALPEWTAVRPEPLLPADRLALASALSHNHCLARLTCHGDWIATH